MINLSGESADFLRKELVELKEGNKDLSKKGRLFAFVYTSEGIQFELQVNTSTQSSY